MMLPVTVTPVSTFPLDGMQTASARFNNAAEAISSGAVDAEKMVELAESQRAFEANAAVAKSANDTLGTVLDAFA